MSRYDDRTALVVVDLQNDFADPAGSLSVVGGDAIVPRVNQAVADALEHGAFVVATQDWHPESTPHFAKDGGIWPVHCVKGRWGAEFHPDLLVLPGAPVVRKGTGGEDGYSAFSVRDPLSGDVRRTELGELLRERGIEHLVIAGLATDYCVKESGLDAVRLGFHPTVLTGAVRPVDLQPGDGERALAAMEAAGVELVQG